MPVWRTICLSASCSLSFSSHFCVSKRRYKMVASLSFSFRHSFGQVLLPKERSMWHKGVCSSSSGGGNKSKTTETHLYCLSCCCCCQATWRLAHIITCSSKAVLPAFCLRLPGNVARSLRLTAALDSGQLTSQPASHSLHRLRPHIYTSDLPLLLLR